MAAPEEEPHPAEPPSPADHKKSCFYCPDFFFLIGWIGSVITLISIAMKYGVDAMEDADLNDESGKSEIFIIFVLAMLFSIVITQIWVKIMIKFGTSLIACCFFIASGMMGFMCVLCLTYELVAMGCVFAILGGLVMLYYCCYRSHMLLAGKTLSIASKIVRAYPATELIALLMVCITAVWSFLFGMAVYGMDEYCADQDYSPFETFMAWFALVLIYYWGIQVFKSIVICTVAGTTAEWWFSRSSPHHPTWHAFFRACTYNLGAICFGSFFVSIIQAVTTALNFIKREVEKVGGTPGKVLGAVLCCCVCAAGCLAKCAEWMTGYAYIVVGMYGYGFVRSGGHVVSLFTKHGLLIAEQDFIVSLIILMGCVVVALVTGAFGALLAKKGPDSWTEGVSDPLLVAGFVSALIGFGIGSVCLAVIEAADQAVLIAFMEHPKTLEDNHPDEHALLSSTWKLMNEKEEEQPVEVTAGAPAKPEEMEA